MIRAVIFGGTTEGRKLCEVCAKYAVPIRYCVATTDGAHPVEALPNVNVRVGRLKAAEMASLIQQDNPVLVMDATHPYAEEAGRNVAEACRGANVPIVRVARESAEESGCMYFTGMDDLLAWLEREPGNIFVTTGASHAEAFTRLPDYQHRVWIRILPSVESLRICLDSGYRPERLLCMQGPFSEELNRAIFKAANVKILVTKNSGAAGGFPEKVRAAQSLGMLTAVLSKPEDPNGISFSEARLKIMELRV